MSELSGGQTARQWLERQLEELGSLYNAGVRSPAFREWRQATLTCVQRIWPSEPARPERFRRIPFSPPMGRPAERDVREYYERGCGEAGSLLKDYIAEIASVGLSDPNAAAASAATAPPGPGTSEDGFPTVDLPGFAGARSPDSQPAHAPVGSAGNAGIPPKPRLKDMLGFFDEPVVANMPDPVPPPEPALRDSSGPVPGNAPVVPIASDASVTPSTVRPSESAARAAFDPGELERVAEELLRATSALSAMPRRSGQDRRTNAREMRSPVALAVAALAIEVEALGVPEGHRARARAVLLDLSRRMDAPELTWEMLREAVSFVMEFPGLGRRVVPLLLPYLDRAA